jgi:hypothetical protein
MKYILAAVSLGLFGWLGLGIAMRGVPMGIEAPFGSISLGPSIDAIIDGIGPGLCGAGLMIFGVLLAVWLLKRGRVAA